MTDAQAPDVVVTEAPVDGGFDVASVEAAETLWACLPHGRKWTSLATHEKALVIHTFARLSTQSAKQARIEELEAALTRAESDFHLIALDNRISYRLQGDAMRARDNCRATLSNIGGSRK